METLQTSGIPAEQVADLEHFARCEAGPELRDVLLSIAECLRNGSQIALLDDSTTLTPSEVAKRLNLSRTHLYKLLDRGEIVSHRVGRDRRIRARDLVEFEAKRQRDRRELAERFAGQGHVREGAIDELAELL